MLDRFQKIWYSSDVSWEQERNFDQNCCSQSVQNESTRAMRWQGAPSEQYLPGLQTRPTHTQKTNKANTAKTRKKKNTKGSCSRWLWHMLAVALRPDATKLADWEQMSSEIFPSCVHYQNCRRMMTISPTCWIPWNWISSGWGRGRDEVYYVHLIKRRCVAFLTQHSNPSMFRQPFPQQKTAQRERKKERELAIISMLELQKLISQWLLLWLYLKAMGRWSLGYPNVARARWPICEPVKTCQGATGINHSVLL